VVRALVVGGGGREHAITEALLESGAEIYASASRRNPGIARKAKAFLEVPETAVDKIVPFATGARVEMAVIGPEAPLGAGLTDALEKAGVPTVGPTQEAARLETSKEFTRRLLKEANIPGSLAFWTFGDLEAFSALVKDIDFEIVIKPVGLTGGKGVKVQGDHFSNAEEALECAREILDARVGGVARFLVERKAVGEEFSLQAFVDGTHVVPMPLARDHKRAQEGDRGPNTGGMGSVTLPDHLLPWVSKWDHDEAVGILERTVEAMRARGTLFRGILYGGFMATREGPKLLEYNVRFADPEGINVLALMEDDLADVFQRLLDGRLPATLKFARQASVCKYVCPPGYGAAPRPGGVLRVDEAGIRAAGAHAFYGSLDEREDGLHLAASRGLAVLAVHEELPVAERRAEDALKFIQGEYAVRHDIGTAALMDHYAARMRRLREG
jgi:phosphoribosylamine--glycine ligase